MSEVTTYAPTSALRAAGLLREFNDAGMLSAADVHVAQRLGALGGEADEAVLLAVALVVRSTRHGSVVVDLSTARDTTVADDDEAVESTEVDLSWPDTTWTTRCAASTLVGQGRPLRIDGDRLWLARYWEQEQQVADQLLLRSATRPDDLALEVLAAGVRRLFGAGADQDQRTAAAVCALSWVSVLAGGPGTGKTTTVARVLALLREQHPQCRIALAAPTGKAAARLEEAVRSSAAHLSPADRASLGELSAVTLHRLLGWRPGARSRFRHDATNRLPFEVVVVDESSMVSLTMMARLLEALRPTTRLVLVGDPDQLASVEAGAVLGDLVDRATLGRRTPSFAATLRAVLPDLDITEQTPSPAAAMRDGVTALHTNHRTDVPEIAELAAHVQAGRADRVLELLASGAAHVELVELEDDARLSEVHLAGVRADVLASGAALHAAASRCASRWPGSATSAPCTRSPCTAARAASSGPSPSSCRRPPQPSAPERRSTPPCPEPPTTFASSAARRPSPLPSAAPPRGRRACASACADVDHCPRQPARNVAYCWASRSRSGCSRRDLGTIINRCPCRSCRP